MLLVEGVALNRDKDLLGSAKHEVVIHDREYRLDMVIEASKPSSVTRLIIPSYMPNEAAAKLLKTCIRSIQHFTLSADYELWVVDNCSPRHLSEWLLSEKGINVVLSRTKPLPPDRRTWLDRIAFWRSQQLWGSYSNAIGIEIARRLIKEDAKRIMTLHMDTVAAKSGWLSYLESKCVGEVKAAGVCLEFLRFPEDGVLHVLGCLVDYQSVLSLRLDYFPDLPQRDVGDNITLGLRGAGYKTFCCRNTFNSPAIARAIKDARFHDIQVVRSLDDEGNVIFMHLGRGIPKADKTYVGKSAPVDAWIDFVDNVLINGSAGAESA